MTPLPTVAVETCGDCMHLKLPWGGGFGCRNPAVMQGRVWTAVREYTDVPDWFVPLARLEGQAPHERFGESRPIPHRDCPYRTRDA